MLTVRLKPEIEAQIREQIAAGKYGSIDEAIEDAFVALEERERARWLRESLHAAAAQMDRGEGVELTDEWWNEQVTVAIERANAGEQPAPNVRP